MGNLEEVIRDEFAQFIRQHKNLEGKPYESSTICSMMYIDENMGSMTIAQAIYYKGGKPIYKIRRDYKQGESKMKETQNACPKCGKEMLAMFHCEFCGNPIKSEPTLNKDTLEQYIDKYGLSETLSHIADICYNKAEHLKSNWQDESTARVWEKDAEKIMALSIRVEQY